MSRFPQEHLNVVVEALLSNPANELGGVPVVDLADGLDMLDAKTHRVSRSLYAMLNKLVAQRRVVQTHPTPYARFRAFEQPLTPKQLEVEKQRLLAKFGQTPIRAASVGNDEQRLFVVNIEVEEGDVHPEVVVVHADSEREATQKVKRWVEFQGLDFDAYIINAVLEVTSVSTLL